MPLVAIIYVVITPVTIVKDALGGKLGHYGSPPPFVHAIKCSVSSSSRPVVITDTRHAAIIPFHTVTPIEQFMIWKPTKTQNPISGSVATDKFITVRWQTMFNTKSIQSILLK